jgi:hypothetical protein
MKGLLFALALIALAGCASDASTLRQEIRKSGFTGIVHVPSNPDFLDGEVRTVEFADGKFVGGEGFRILDMRSLDDWLQAILFLRTIDRGPTSALSLTDVGLYRRDGDGWSLVSDVGWGDSARAGIRAFRVLGSDRLKLQRFAPGLSLGNSDLVGFETVVYQFKEGRLVEIERSALTPLEEDEWPVEWFRALWVRATMKPESIQRILQVRACCRYCRHRFHELSAHTISCVNRCSLSGMIQIEETIQYVCI